MRFLKALSFICLLATIPLDLFAQPGDPGGGNPTVPITGIEVLIGLGGALGARKLLKRKKTDNS